MELFSVSIKGFRRFARSSMLRTNGKVLALIGPNEAGKSSVLDAITGLTDERPLAQSDIARDRTADDLEIIGKFLLDADELNLSRLSGPQWLKVHKGLAAKRGVSFEPPIADRDISHRQPAIDAARTLLDDNDVMESITEISPDFAANLEAVLTELETSRPNLEAPTRTNIKAIGDSLTNLRAVFDERPLVHLADRWTTLVDLEAAPSPLQHAIDTLWPRVPDILLFDEPSRRLASSYPVAQLRQEIPPALQSIFELAKLDFAAVVVAIDTNDGARLTTIEHRANLALDASFREVWRQSGIRVALRFATATVELQIVNENSDFTPLAERSDGLRQFVALYAFVSVNRANNPILLIDEAEQRLHYDAQADLVQMLTRQAVVSKVIYTTHSAGCLPEDLGQGVRLIEPCAERVTESRIANKFWSNPGPGFSPLLFGLGAATLAFFPTRHAVCVEGPSDMLLYPTLFREALGADVLGFQIVPGLSSSARALAPILPAAAGNIAFLVDGDPGGRMIRDDLVAHGVADDRVIVLADADGGALELEDFIAPELLLGAANALIGRHHPGAEHISAVDMPVTERMAWLEGAYRAAAGAPLPKVELAYEILDLRDARPDQMLLDPQRSPQLAAFARRVQAIFQR